MGLFIGPLMTYMVSFRVNGLMESKSESKIKCGRERTQCLYNLTSAVIHIETNLGTMWEGTTKRCENQVVIIRGQIGG
jgi:hypothetical protein